MFWLKHGFCKIPLVSDCLKCLLQWPSYMLNKTMQSGSRALRNNIWSLSLSNVKEESYSVKKRERAMGHTYLKYKPSHYNENIPSVLHLPISTSFLLFPYSTSFHFSNLSDFFSPLPTIIYPPKDTKINSIHRNSISYLKHFKDYVYMIFIYNKNGTQVYIELYHLFHLHVNIFPCH